MTVSVSSKPTPEQRQRDEMQIQWLINALRRQSEPREFRLDEGSLRIGSACPACGAIWWGGK
jgi:hypothetical protein